MAKLTSRVNAKKSAIRAKVEPVFAGQKDRMELLVRTIGLARAELKNRMAKTQFALAMFGGFC